MSTLRLNILKTHLASGQWVHAGTQADVEESRANELVRLGLAEPADAKAEGTPAPRPTASRAARVPLNKKMPDPDNKSAGPVTTAGQDALQAMAAVPASAAADSASPAPNADTVDQAPADPEATQADA